MVAEREVEMTLTAPPHTVFEIADWFLARAKSENKPLKHMKLQKLVYFAYGWYYAYIDQPLFGETIYAWRLGPVVKELYDQFKHFKNTPITGDVVEKNIDTTVELLLDSVWKAYEMYPDTHLSNITHTHTPWINAYRSDEWYAVMSPESIRDYFKKICLNRIPMPDIDFSQILAVAQDEAKHANENFRLHVLAENERLREDNASLSDLRVQNGKLKIKIQFYRATKWCRERAAIALTGLGLIPLAFPAGLPIYLRLFCFGFVCVAATLYFFGLYFGRIDTDD